MKAFLLAAGIGSRLRPITDTIPKCMLEVGGQPLLGIWLDELDRAGADEVLVNLHHMEEVVRAYVGQRAGPPAVRLVREPELLGSAGAVKKIETFFGDEHFLVIGCDEVTDMRLDRLQADVMALVGVRLGTDRRLLFEQVRALARERAGLPPAPADTHPARARATVPYLNEPWYC